MFNNRTGLRCLENGCIIGTIDVDADGVSGAVGGGEAEGVGTGLTTAQWRWIGQGVGPVAGGEGIEAKGTG